jgi:hypothetical protein
LEFSSNRTKASAVKRLRPLVEKWGKNSNELKVGGECLRAKQIEVYETDFSLVMHIEGYTECLLPWVELYLKIRNEIPKKQWPRYFSFEALRS